MLFVLLRRASPIWETSSLADLWRLGGRGAGLVAPVWHLFFKRNKSVSRPRFYYQPSVCDNWFIIIHLFVFSLNRRALLRFPSSPASFSIPPPHISPVLLLLLPPCLRCGTPQPWWTLPARWRRPSRCRRSNRWTSTTSIEPRSAPAFGGCCRNPTALQVPSSLYPQLRRILGGALNNLSRCIPLHMQLRVRLTPLSAFKGKPFSASSIIIILCPDDARGQPGPASPPSIGCAVSTARAGYHISQLIDVSTRLVRRNLLSGAWCVEEPDNKAFVRAGLSQACGEICNDGQISLLGFFVDLGNVYV